MSLHERAFPRLSLGGGLSSTGRPAASALMPKAGGVPLRLEGVVKEFSGRRVLDGIDLAVPAGQSVAVVGRSGGGKSTLMRLIAGLDRPTAGRILAGGEPVAGARPDVRLLFQDARLLPWQRVAANVGIARGRGWRERALAALADVGLADRAEDWPSVLSGGQRQRVALARALVSDPGLLLLDEPFGALDALTRQEMHRLLIRIREEHGFTSLLITHDVAEAVALADRVLVLRDGRIALDLAVDLPYPRPPGNRCAAELESLILGEV
ncbi:ATP-binding cassette domain-containing protein [Azospirillum sp. SYSU D00513]|uniref:ATP-binding cassette domain-containing protein n=1 Tax=Azospirillum sp. SYSU D00513 TaxID=2812561 RepID=UPI001A95F3D5|nr:ATP-binding cassette domain-containing protein [Azospirillum sp. SYSU D00513]